MSVSSYSKIYAIGHPAVSDLFDGPVSVEEKVDGSQFSFVRDAGERLFCRSRNVQLDTDAPDQMFREAVESARALDLRPGWLYRGEYLRSPKQNTIRYARIPLGHIVIFDIATDVEQYLSPLARAAEAARIGLEVVPLLHLGPVASPSELLAFLDRESCLGGSLVEGVVVKNYARYGEDKHVLMGKLVRDEFKETNKADWRERHPSSGDIVSKLVDEYCNPMRWAKAVQHLREAGKLEQSPRDIGALIEEARRDLEEECAEEIKSKLWSWAKRDVLGKATRGLPDWYKRTLLEGAFKAGEP